MAVLIIPVWGAGPSAFLADNLLTITP